MRRSRQRDRLMRRQRATNRGDGAGHLSFGQLRAEISSTSRPTTSCSPNARRIGRARQGSRRVEAYQGDGRTGRRRPISSIQISPASRLPRTSPEPAMSASQIGYRIAHDLKLPVVYAIDEHGRRWLSPIISRSASWSPEWAAANGKRNLMDSTSRPDEVKSIVPRIERQASGKDQSPTLLALSPNQPEFQDRS